MEEIMNKFKRGIASLMVVSMTALGLPLHANAGIVSTQEVASASADRAKVEAFLARDDVRKGLEAQGISSAAALDRVNMMTDEEVTQLAGRIDQAPAGGDVLGTIVGIGVLLLITDILGFTKIYPFTRSVR
jgi:hypothetical protein